MKCQNPNCDNDAKNKYCSSSCSAIMNNKLFPKRQKLKPTNNCKNCNTPIKTRYIYCKKCSNTQWERITLSEYGNNIPVWHYHAKLRSMSRNIYNKSNKPKHCFYCGYSIYYEVCHIQPIASFPKTSTVADVNHIDNLIALCPNHHYEFDKGLITVG